MIVFFLRVLTKICPFQGVRLRLVRLTKLAKEALGYISPNDVCKLLQAQNAVIVRSVQRSFAIAMLHRKTFGEFKNAFRGRSVVLIGAGPSASKYIPIHDVINVGLNRACLLSSISFDYLFTIDKAGVDKIYDEFGSTPCLKFVGDQNLGPKFQIPESEIAKWGNVRRYKTDADLFPAASKFSLDIENEALGNFNTVSLQAMQFILYGNPAKVYLVGIDCSNKGHFTSRQGDKDEMRLRVKNRGEDIDKWADSTRRYWLQLKEFASMYYPDTEIISVNPVGLRGLFDDLDQHVEIES